MMQPSPAGYDPSIPGQTNPHTIRVGKENRTKITQLNKQRNMNMLPYLLASQTLYMGF